MSADTETIARLEDFIQDRRAVPFAWGTADCATFVFDAVQAMTGRDPAAHLRGRWSGVMSAARVFNEQGGWEGFAERGGFGAPVAAEDLQNGDVALLEAGHCSGLMAAVGALGIVCRGHVVAQGEDGLRALPLSAAAGGWRAA